MMFGTRDSFEYFECARCGCLQICEIPDDLARYYPSDYYAFTPPSRREDERSRLRRMREAAVLTRRDLVGRLLAAVGSGRIAEVARWLRRMGTTRTSRILDVGCGAGELLCDLGEAGFTRLTGVDPFIPHELSHPSGAKILKGTIHDVEGTFDVVMLHHALEHIPDQLATLRAVVDRLAPGGYCLVRVPTVSSYAWEHYGVDWVQLDAPRHFFLHSLESLRLLGERAGLTLKAVEFDSTAFQFIGSELYRRDRPLTSGTAGFSRAEVWRFRTRARVLNAARRGDQAAFYFTVGTRRAGEI
jgi:SAM-dependent methyltransferase